MTAPLTDACSLCGGPMSRRKGFNYCPACDQTHQMTDPAHLPQVKRGETKP